MTQYAETFDRSKYLLLGFLAQEVVTALVRTLGDRPDHTATERALHRAQELLGRLVEPASTGGKALPSYQEIRTIKEVATEEQLAAILDLLQQLEGETAGQDSQVSKEKAKEVIQWFAVLQDRALHNFRSESEPIPTGLQKLCSTT